MPTGENFRNFWGTPKIPNTLRGNLLRGELRSPVPGMEGDRNFVKILIRLFVGYCAFLDFREAQSGI